MQLSIINIFVTCLCVTSTLLLNSNNVVANERLARAAQWKTFTPRSLAAPRNGPVVGKYAEPVTRVVSTPVYNGGPVITNPIFYIIWYGNWTGNNAVPLITNFLQNIGANPWWSIVNAYNSSGSITYGTAMNDSYSEGTYLTWIKIANIVQKAINSRSLPSNKSGIYLVLTSSDCYLDGFCWEGCSWHDYFANGIIYGWVGNPSLFCPDRCGQQCVTPNNNFGADSMVNFIAHEAAEMVTNPTNQGWFDVNGDEIADVCSCAFNGTSLLDRDAYYNVQVGTKKYLIQSLWKLSTQSCAIS